MEEAAMGSFDKKNKKEAGSYSNLFLHILRSFTINLQEAVVSRHGSTKYSVES